jgi:methylated-DNA-[protein]-cysteine S-methyltransferase
MPTWRADRFDHPVVPLTIAVDDDDDALVWVGFGHEPEGLLRHAARHGAKVGPERRPSTPAREQLREYLDGRRCAFELRLRLLGTPFSIAAWEALCAIPYGRTSTYGEQARVLGRPAAARAVGRANATNPIAIVVPCHRVIGSSGSLTGFGGGLDIKQWLLELEAAGSSQLGLFVSTPLRG